MPKGKGYGSVRKPVASSKPSVQIHNLHGKAGSELKVKPNTAKTIPSTNHTGKVYKNNI